MGEKLPGMLLSLLFILKVFGSTEASCRISGSSAYCGYQGLTSVPQNLPTGITELWLQDNLITTLSQSEFSQYVSLTNLHLENNHIATKNISQAFYNLSYLTHLGLDGNRLSNLSADMFTGLGNLERLALSNNKISDIQTGTFSSTPQLTALYLNQNKLTNLSADMFTGLGNLETLDLHNNDISDIQTGAFSSTPQLGAMWLDQNNLTTLRSDMFTGLGNLNTLYLTSNEISDIQAGTFNSTPQLRGLHQGENKLTDLRPDMFTGLGNLETLYLTSNEISDIQAGTFSSTTQLRYLDLHNNKLANLRPDMFTGLGNLEGLYLYNNEISCIQAGTFSSTTQLRYLYLHTNKLTNLRSDMFTGLGNLDTLYLYNNDISNIQVGTFNSTPQLTTLHLRYNRLEVLKADIFAVLSSILIVIINNNPWQCDCRILPFRQKMNGSHSFENQITCEGPSNFHGQKLQDISPEDLICEEPTIPRFGRGDTNTVVEGETLHFVCEASGIPTPDITVILPSGLTAAVESVGRVTVDVNGTITITNVTAADAGLYVCIAASPVGSAFASLVAIVQLNLATTGTVTTVAVDTTGTVAPNQPQPALSFSLPILIGCVCGSVAGTLLIVTIILTIWHKRKTQNPPSGSTPPVVFSNASASVAISDQTEQGGAQKSTSESLNDKSSKHSPGHHDSQGLEYEDVLLPTRDSGPSNAGLRQQPAEYQSLVPNRNRVPSDELPPLPPSQNQTNRELTGTHDTQHYYLSLKK